ncbi:MAG: 50S ribosomal protein L4 [Candidatus Woesebacteria bacterium]|nr:50S ribosomal protein L4 [Candidatus Woesebacteria bacterium]
MTKVLTFTSKGTKTEMAALPAEFNQKVNMALLAQAVHVFEERSHVGLRKTKTRSEVNRTTKKIYKQKGTGGARHGSRRANVFVGGGVALGPRPVRRILNLSGQMKARARLLAYSLKAGDGQLILVSGLSKIEKTKSASALIAALIKATGAKRFTFVLSEGAKPAAKFFRNLSAANAIFWKDANAYDIFDGGMIVLDSEIFPKKTKTK